jgi:hypothetical protein
MRSTGPGEGPPPGARRAPVVVVGLDVAVKAGLVALLLVAVIWPDLGGLKGKAAGARLVVYPLGAAVVPLVWWTARRTRPGSRPGAFPWLGDLLFSLPWFLDTLGNRLNLFDTLWWWDDWMHFLSWGLLTAAVLVLFAPDGGLWPMVERALAFGCGSALLWELGEYAAFIRNSPELQTAYTDTLGDLALGTLGSLVAAILVWRVRVRRRSREPVGASRQR